MNVSLQILVLIAGSNIDFFLPARLLCAHSAWFTAAISNREMGASIIFPFSDASVLEAVLVFMCTGVLRLSDHMGHQLHAALEMAMVAHKLVMEDLEWYAVGKLEEYFDVNRSSQLRPDEIEIERVFHSTGSTSHLCEWLTNHIAGCLTSGTMMAAALVGLTTAEPAFVTMIVMSIQTTAFELTKVPMDADVRKREKARGKAMDRLRENEIEEVEDDSKMKWDEVDSADQPRTESGEGCDKDMDDEPLSEDEIESEAGESISDEDSEL
jgi:hypothetical protein